ncbi:hypothetical protein N3K66_006566 [Trichothecium roseum]|uniref:Uncharacterized protein n=1 Tax=Trichothecium roseum TaxID=47278 RepID=A0ACC0UVQ0_9HYPO|nr:hypothetical protein N3K66_006566 [Trichothecium roseum]
MASSMTTQKDLPSTFNKDLQEIMELTLSEKMKATFDSFMLTTGVTDYLVCEGVPFRETYRISGRSVAESEQTGAPMKGSPFGQMKEIDERFEPDISKPFTYKTSVERRSARGSTSTSSVLEQIQMLSTILE